MEYFDLALEDAWKVHAVLPIKNLTRGKQILSPYEYFFGVKPSIKKFRVPFYPCVMNAGPKELKTTGSMINRKNHLERGIRGIHVGLPRGSAGWLVYVPSTGKISVSQDVVFDEDSSRVRSGNAQQNLATMRRIALNLLKSEQSRKQSLKGKLQLAGWDASYMEKIIFR